MSFLLVDFSLLCIICHRQCTRNHEYETPPGSTEQESNQFSSIPAESQDSTRSSHYEHLKMEHEYLTVVEPYVKIRESTIEPDRDGDGYEEI